MVRIVHEKHGAVEVVRNLYMVPMAVVAEEVVRAVFVDHEDEHVRDHVYEREGVLEHMVLAAALGVAGAHNMDLSRIHTTRS